MHVMNSAIRTGLKTKDKAAALIWGESSFVVRVTLIVLALTSIPYVYGYLVAQPGKEFMGIMVDVPDHAQYFSWMRELSTSHLAANKLTPETNSPVLFNLLWWGMGRLGTMIGLGYAGMFQVLRVSAGAAFLLLVYRVIGLFLKDLWSKRIAFMVVAFTSGFGWILVVLKYTFSHGQLIYPLDVFIAEGNTFLGILGYPHFIAAALYILVFDQVLRGQSRGQLRYALAAGLLAQFFGWQHAYDLVLVYGILAGYTALVALRDRRLPVYLVRSNLILWGLSCWPAIYSLVLTRADPIWEKVLDQFANAGVYTPNPFHLIILLGPAFLLAIFAFVKDNPLRLAGVEDHKIFLRSWFLFNFLLIYIPTDFQIHMLNGWQVPIAILATHGLVDYLAPFLRGLAVRLGIPGLHWTSLRRALGIVLVLVILPTNLYLWTWRFVELGRGDYPYYLHRDELVALDWLEANGRPDDVVLSSLTIGQYIPALTGKHAFLAHWAQTLDFFAKSDMVAEFFNLATAEDRRLQIIDAYGVDFIFYGPAERELGGYLPASSSYLSFAFSVGEVEIFEIASELSGLSRPLIEMDVGVIKGYLWSSKTRP